MAFWDASAIVPLCRSQAGSVRGRKLLTELRRMVVWWGTPVEARSAFARLLRDNHLTVTQHRIAVERLSQLRRAWDEHTGFGESARNCGRASGRLRPSSRGCVAACRSVGVVPRMAAPTAVCLL